MDLNKTSCMNTPKKILSIKHPSQINLDELKNDFEQIDYFEFRLDDFSPEDHKVAWNLKQMKPWILKSLDFNRIFSHLEKNPIFIDVDFFSQIDIYHEIIKKYAVILSAHLRADLEEVKILYRSMRNFKAEMYKLVVIPKNQIECLKIVKFFREIKEKNVVRFCMGEDFSYTRYFGLIDQHPFIYIGLDGMLTASGQISLSEIKNYQNVYSQPKILGLIGDPVTKSISDIVYNFYFKQKNISAIYLKIRLKENEFDEGINLLKEIGFLGLSVTTPLKAKASTFHADDFEMPCNTLILKNPISAFNTDNQALLNILEKSVDLQGLKVLVIGCGPLAISFMKALINKKALVYVKNRTQQKIESLKKKLPILSYENEPVTVVVQATSKEFFEENPIEEEFIDAEIYVESVVIPVFTCFAKNYLLKNQKVYLGYELFLEQGILQLKKYLENEPFDDFFTFLKGITIKELQRKC